MSPELTRLVCLGHKRIVRGATVPANMIVFKESNNNRQFVSLQFERVVLLLRKSLYTVQNKDGLRYLYTIFTKTIVEKKINPSKLQALLIS